MEAGALRINVIFLVAPVATFLWVAVVLGMYCAFASLAAVRLARVPGLASIVSRGCGVCRARAVDELRAGAESWSDYLSRFLMLAMAAAVALAVDFLLVGAALQPYTVIYYPTISAGHTTRSRSCWPGFYSPQCRRSP